MNANEMTFGIEIETTAPRSNYDRFGLRIGGYHDGVQVPYLPTGWKAERDGSIRYADGYEACEIVSPVLRGLDGLQQVFEVLAALEAHGHKVNESCGVHVHVGWGRRLPSDALARLIGMVAYAEKGLYAITGTKHREQGCYCGGVRKYGNGKDAKANMDRNRYHLLNLVPLATGRREAVEFRVFSGSLNATKVLGWVQVCLGLVERAINGKRTPVWEPKALTGGWAKGGPGASEAERLMGFLAWGDGYAATKGGRVFGWVGGPVEMAAVKAEFRRLAAKYDGQAA